MLPPAARIFAVSNSCHVFFMQDDDVGDVDAGTPTGAVGANMEMGIKSHLVGTSGHDCWLGYLLLVGSCALQ